MYIVREYSKGREKKFFLREDKGTFFFEKITKACGFALKVGTESEVQQYIKDNGYKLLRWVVATETDCLQNV